MRYSENHFDNTPTAHAATDPKKLKNMLERLLLMWLCISSGIAFLWPRITAAAGPDIPDVFSQGGKTLPYAICVTMFSIGWLLPKDEVNQLIRRWRLVLLGTGVQFVSMPLLAYGVTQIVPLGEEMRIGILVVGCVPGAMASNVLTMLSGGNVSYSVSLTTMATLISPIFVPFILRLFLGQTFPVQQTFVLLLWTVVLPTLAGHLCGRRFSGLQAVMKPVAKNVASLTILWIIAVVVGLNRDRLGQVTPMIVIALLILNVSGYLCGFFAGGMFGLDTRMRRALSLEVGMQNAGLGTTLAAQIFTNRPEILIPTALYTFGCMLTGTMLARYWGTKSPEISPAES